MPVLAPLPSTVIPQTSIPQVDLSPKRLFLLLVIKSRMRGPLGERNQMGCLLPHASFSFQPQLWKHGGTWRVGLAAPSEACIWIPLRRVGAPPLGGRVYAGAQQPARLTADQCAWPSPFRPTTHLKVIRR